MPRRKSRSSGARARRSKTPRRPGRQPKATTVSSIGRNTPRQRLGTRKTVPKRRAVHRLSDTSEPSRGAESPRRRRDEMLARQRDRRATLRARRTPSPFGLQATRMWFRDSDENASGKKTRRGLCARKKKASGIRRAVIIANGYGGINGAVKYAARKLICK